MTSLMPEFSNVAVHLSRMAETHPFKPAIYFPAGRDGSGRVTYSVLTFRQLDNLSNRIGRGLLARGLKPGMRTVLMVTPSPDFFALTFGLLKSGIIPVMVDPGMGAGKLKICLNEAEPEAFIGIPKAHLARIILGWARKTVKKLITVSPIGPLKWGDTLQEIIDAGSDEPFFPANNGEFSDPFNPDDMAAINFTSGSTGVPKGAVYTHGIFAAQVELIRHTYSIEPGEIDLCTFPLFALFAPALGMTAIIPDMDFTRPANVNPERIVEAMNDFGPTNMFGSTALLNRVGRYCSKHSIRFPSLRRVICAGAPINPEVLRYFTPALSDGAEVHSGYGATEAMPLASISSDTILTETGEQTDQGAGVCVGTPNEGIKMDIIGITDDAIETWDDSLAQPANTIGEIVTHGPVVTQSYFNRDEATRLAKIKDEATGRFRHRMGDLGWFDDQGRLWFCGRKKHRLETALGPMYTIPVEGVFNTHPRVFRTALVSLGAPGNEVPVLCVEPESGYTDRVNDETFARELVSELREMGKGFEHTRSVNRFILMKSFPVDIRHNSKIFREKLRLQVGKNKGKVRVES